MVADIQPPVLVLTGNRDRFGPPAMLGPFSPWFEAGTFPRNEPSRPSHLQRSA